jgi:hypothetical protein
VIGPGYRSTATESLIFRRSKYWLPKEMEANAQSQRLHSSNHRKSHTQESYARLHWAVLLALRVDVGYTVQATPISINQPVFVAFALRKMLLFGSTRRASARTPKRVFERSTRLINSSSIPQANEGAFRRMYKLASVYLQKWLAFCNPIPGFRDLCSWKARIAAAQRARLGESER